MPDGSNCGLWISKDETMKEAIDKFLNNWYKVTAEKPELYKHITLEKKCPKCGEQLHAKEYDDETWCWCPYCHYEERRTKQ